MSSSSGSVLITGGAGFIGRALTRRLLGEGHEVAVLDMLHPQVHSGLGHLPDLPEFVRFFGTDVTHAANWDTVLKLIRPAQIVHLAAETGTGQSLLEATRHASVNVVGTAQLLDALTRSEIVPAQFVLASSRAVYGEGVWEEDGRLYYPAPRTHSQLLAQQWDPSGGSGGHAKPVASRAGRTEPRPTSIYAATKLTQEHLLSAWARAHGAGISVLRLQNVYGPGQSLGNPYTGIVSLFARLALANRQIEVFEDGQMVRDFVYVDDVVDALAAAVRTLPAEPRFIDVGSGFPITVGELAREIATLCDAPDPVVVPKFRDGDVRAASCDIKPATAELEWKPAWSLSAGLQALVEWIDAQEVPY